VLAGNSTRLSPRRRPGRTRASSAGTSRAHPGAGRRNARTGHTRASHGPNTGTGHTRASSGTNTGTGHTSASRGSNTGAGHTGTGRPSS